MEGWVPLEGNLKTFDILLPPVTWRQFIEGARLLPGITEEHIRQMLFANRHRLDEPRYEQKENKP